uniref:PB1-like domain-containing protein n=1 Tax=Nelumbo nucifera TaxID=4432 RepID=A0A822ZGM2_NELNU|nr:TPA_asm: hypothetical protein HUJ06_001983 [Nelumbo nucifera]
MPPMIYTGGDVFVNHNVDGDLLSFIEIQLLIKDLGYNKIGDLLYKKSNANLDDGLVWLKFVADVVEMCKVHERHRHINIYVTGCESTDTNMSQAMGSHDLHANHDFPQPSSICHDLSPNELGNLDDLNYGADFGNKSKGDYGSNVEEDPDYEPESDHEDNVESECNEASGDVRRSTTR